METSCSDAQSDYIFRGGFPFIDDDIVRCVGVKFLCAQYSGNHAKWESLRLLR